MVDTVTFDENSNVTAAKIAMWLLQNGFIPADSSGKALSVIRHETSFGILWQDPDTSQEESFLGVWTRKKRPIFLGQISFVYIDGTDSAQWNACIYGKEYAEIYKDLIERLKEEFGVEATICLHSQPTRKIFSLESVPDLMQSISFWSIKRA